MDELDLPYLGAGAIANQAYPSEKMVRMPTMKERLELAVREAEAKLAIAKRARELFDKNPDLEELLDLMQKGRF